MDSSEIKSPAEGSQQGTPGNSLRRKKLAIYFIESEDRRMAFGRGYTAGSTPVDIHGKSIVDLSKTGGWIAAFFIFGIYIIMCQFTYSFFKCFETFFQLELQFYLNNLHNMKFRLNINIGCCGETLIE